MIDLHYCLKRNLVYVMFLAYLSSCSSEKSYDKIPLFQSIPSRISNINFNNTLTETDTLNYFLYPYMYMGGGVSVGDFNDDGLADIFFSGNMVSNRLYINLGNFKFKDVTEISKIGGDGGWMQGSTICDINNDGLVDIYVSVSGINDNCRNLLFVNQGNTPEGIPIFIEKASEYGIDDNGKSTQSTFFDYDNDGDDDLYVANYPITQFKSPAFFYRQMINNARMNESGHLYRNNGDGTFSNVTQESGLLTFSLALSATVSDLNRDGFKDIYFSSDFTSPDFFFFNNGDGTFTDRTRDVAGQTSFYGMGADIADYNNDGLLDIMQIDMAPEDNKRAKENMSAMHPDDFEEMVNEGLHHQYRYSTLQLNMGIMNNGLPRFGNAAWMAGVTETDWSWAALFADFDLDGWKDLFITNGIRRDINNLDFFNSLGEVEEKSGILDNHELLVQVKKMPSEKLENYVYRNNGDLTFSKNNKEWGIVEEGFSNGVAYADLDNDGDLEIIINRIDQKALIYKNNAVEKKSGNFLKISFEGLPKNRLGTGTKVSLWNAGKMQFSEITLSRGYISSVEPILYFGLDRSKMVDSLLVTWGDGKTQILRNLNTNQKIILNYSDAGTSLTYPANSKKLFEEITSKNLLEFNHVENKFNDFLKQVLLPHKLSSLGPGIAAGDINNDGREDFFIGNASLNAGKMFLQQHNGTFLVQRGPWESDIQSDDIGCTLFDADQDGDLDLYVVNGGYEFPSDSKEYADRLYINKGKEGFFLDENALPSIYSSGSCVKPVDFDKDGDLDLFVGGRQLPWKYPFPVDSYILENKSVSGKVNFVDATSLVAPGLKKAGMITDALCADMDGDEWPDLITAGEWMPICYFKNNNGKFDKTELKGTRGWWFSIEGADMDKDGDIDFLAGNLGLNFRYKATPDKTFDIYAGDFNNNGGCDIALSYFQNNKQYPLRGRSCFIYQNPWIAAKFPSYAEFGEATISDIYSNKLLENSLHLKAETFASSYFENTGNGNFLIHPLVNEAQLSSINDFIIEDFDNDEHLDILAAGNLFDVEIVTPRNDAGIGIILKGDGHGSFKYIPPELSGFIVPGDVKSLSMIHLGNFHEDKAILVGNNNAALQIFRVK